MTTKEIREQVAAIKKCTRKVVASKSTAQKFLVSTGVYTKKGNLKKQFK